MRSWPPAARWSSPWAPRRTPASAPRRPTVRRLSAYRPAQWPDGPVMRMRMQAAPLVLALVLLGRPLAVRADEGAYVPETDPLVLKKLATWQDWKFGFMAHWGPYSQWGVVESWSI